MISHPHVASVDIWSDTSGSLGCEALCPTLSQWIQLEWARIKAVSGVGGDHNITWMESLPIVLSCVDWGAALRGQRVTVYCDNSTAVAVHWIPVSAGYIVSCICCGAYSSWLTMSFQCRLCMWRVWTMCGLMLFLQSPTFAGILSELSMQYTSGGPPGTGHQGTTRLDDTMLGPVFQELFMTALASSTLKVYKTGTNRYCSFCELYCIHEPFPVSENGLLRFMAYLYKEGLKAGTIKSYLEAVATSFSDSFGLWRPPHRENGFTRVRDVKSEEVDKLSEEVDKWSCSNKVPHYFRLVLLLRLWYSKWRERDAMMLWATASLCFFGFLQVREVIVPSDLGFYLWPQLAFLRGRCQCGQPYLSHTLQYELRCQRLTHSDRALQSIWAEQKVWYAQ